MCVFGPKAVAFVETFVIIRLEIAALSLVDGIEIALRFYLANVEKTSIAVLTSDERIAFVRKTADDGAVHGATPGSSG